MNWTGNMTELRLDTPPIAFPLSGCTTGYWLVVYREYCEQRKTEGRIEKLEPALGADDDS
jgi:hypothetical protein